MTYSSSMSVGRQQFVANNRFIKNQNTTRFNKKRSIGPISNTIILIILGCLLGLLYLTQITKTNAFGYKLNALTVEKQSLQKEHDELEVSSARLQAIDRVKTSAVANNLVSVAPSSTVQN
jgi:hypothetical protein